MQNYSNSGGYNENIGLQVSEMAHTQSFNRNAILVQLLKQYKAIVEL